MIQLQELKYISLISINLIYTYKNISLNSLIINKIISFDLHFHLEFINIVNNYIALIDRNCIHLFSGLHCHSHTHQRDDNRFISANYNRILFSSYSQREV